MANEKRNSRVENMFGKEMFANAGIFENVDEAPVMEAPTNQAPVMEAPIKEEEKPMEELKIITNDISMSPAAKAEIEPKIDSIQYSISSKELIDVIIANAPSEILNKAEIIFVAPIQQLINRAVVDKVHQQYAAAVIADITKKIAPSKLDLVPVLRLTRDSIAKNVSTGIMANMGYGVRDDEFNIEDIDFKYIVEANYGVDNKTSIYAYDDEFVYVYLDMTKIMLDLNMFLLNEGPAIIREYSFAVAQVNGRYHFRARNIAGVSTAPAKK